MDVYDPGSDFRRDKTGRMAVLDGSIAQLPISVRAPRKEVSAAQVHDIRVGQRNTHNAREVTE